MLLNYLKNYYGTSDVLQIPIQIKLTKLNYKCCHEFQLLLVVLHVCWITLGECWIKCQIETNLQVYEVHDVNLIGWGAGRCLGRPLGCWKPLGLLLCWEASRAAGKPLWLLLCWEASRAAGKPLGLLLCWEASRAAGKPLWLLLCWEASRAAGKPLGLLLCWEASRAAGKPLGLLLCWEASESASNVHIFQLSIFWVCSDMINWSGNQCEGIGYVTLLLKDNQVLLPYWTYDSKSNVDLVLLADIFQTQFIKYSSQICSSSSNTVNQIQLQ